jgi:hypothetical protein
MPMHHVVGVNRSYPALSTFAGGSGIVFDVGNTYCITTNNGAYGTKSNNPFSTGKKYWEVASDNALGPDAFLGFVDGSQDMTASWTTMTDALLVRASSGAYAIYQDGDGSPGPGTFNSNNGGRGVVFQFCMDSDNQKAWLGANNNFGSGNPGSGSNAHFVGWTGGKNWRVGLILPHAGVTLRIPHKLHYDPPSGFDVL